MQTPILIKRVDISPCDLATLKGIRRELLGNLSLARQVSGKEICFNIDNYLGVLSDLKEIEMEAYNERFCFNPYLLKLVICKLELLRSSITVKSDLLGYQLMTYIHNSIIHTKTILHSLEW